MVAGEGQSVIEGGIHAVPHHHDLFCFLTSHMSHFVTATKFFAYVMPYVAAQQFARLRLDIQRSTFNSQCSVTAQRSTLGLRFGGRAATQALSSIVVAQL